MNVRTIATCQRFRVFAAADKGPKMVGGDLGEACFPAGTKPIKLGSVPQHLRNKVQTERDGNSTGRTTGLKMTHFADMVLLANLKEHATDYALNATIAAEFPRRVTKANSSGVQGGKTRQAISAYRAYFNRGLHGHNTTHGTDDDRKLIFVPRYNDNGEPYARREAGSRKPKAKAGKASKGKASKAKATAK